VVGDSLSAAYGIPARDGWVQLLQARIEAAGYPHEVINASISGETTKGGLTRLPEALERYRPSVVVLALGGNDGLRGFGPQLTRQHLRDMIHLARDTGANVLLLGVQLPANYGNAFRTKFHAVYHDLSEDESVRLVPFFLDGVALDRTLMQPDGIHPNAKAQPKILDNVWPELEPLLQGNPAKTAAISGVARAPGTR
jgi:acyl-CoA thioesterase-1